MDELFLIFEKWYMSRSADWIDKGITVDWAGLGIWSHQYWIKLHSDYGIGNIVLYESNEYYWVDFEAGNYKLDKILNRGNIVFENESSIAEQTHLIDIGIII